MKHRLKFYWKMLCLTFAAWREDNAARLGAALAFYSILSLGPLLLLVLVAAASIWGRKAAQGQIVEQMTGIIGAEGAKFAQDILRAAANTRHGGFIATLFGFGTLFFSASGVFGELQNALNFIWKVPKPKGKPYIVLLRERFLSFTMVIGSSFLLLISLVVSAGMEAVSQYTDDLIPALDVAMPLVDLVVSLTIITLLFAFTFKMVPDTQVTWRSVWPGAILTSVLFIVGKMLIGFYLASTGVASSYGAAGSLIVILLWVYYSAQILFFGAEFSHVYGQHIKIGKKHR